MTKAWSVSTALVLALGGVAAAQPVGNPYFGYAAPPVSAGPAALPSAAANGANPFFPPQRAVVAPPAGPNGNYLPFFGSVAPAAYSSPATAAPLPAVIPANSGNPFFPDAGSVVRPAGHRNTRPALTQCEPGTLGDCVQPGSPLAGRCEPGTACDADPDSESPDHPSKKHPFLYKMRYGLDPAEPHVWFAAEYLMWHISGDRVVSPVAASTQTTSLAALIADPRGLTTPDNTVQRYGLASGGRLSGGYWKEEYCCVSWGMEWNAFMLEHRGEGFTLESGPSGFPIVLRPFIDSRTGQAGLAVVSFPGAAAGNLSVTSDSFLWGGELNAVRRINEGNGIHWDLIAGLRYLNLEENLSLVQNTTLLGSGIAGFGAQTVRAPNGLMIVDSYDTRNQFFGGQLGTRLGRRYHRLVVDAYAKVALGWSHETADASGSTTLIGSGQTLPGGFLNVPSNSGSRTHDDFAVVPEVGFQLGYDVTKWLRLTTGYSALYWSQVARPGGQVPIFVNPTQVPSSLTFGQPGGDPVQANALARSGLWINGVTFGAMFKY